MARREGMLLVIAAFAAVYLIWGSTYLGIRWAVETMPPFLMASVRWLVAGGVLYAWRRLAGDGAPTAREWRDAAIVGILLVVGGNGLVTLAEVSVPSALTALLIATVPLWMVALDSTLRRAWPTPLVLIGIAVGITGVAILVGDALGASLGRAAASGIALILCACLLWASGSIFSRRARLPSSPLLGASMEMLAGGAVLALLAVARGEPARLDLAAASTRSWLSLGYLIVFGSIVAYSAYVWLLRRVPPALVSTYAFVNPVVAVILGWWLAAEAVTLWTLAGAALIVAAVALIVWSNARAQAAQARSAASVNAPTTSGK